MKMKWVWVLLLLLLLLGLGAFGYYKYAHTKKAPESAKKEEEHGGVFGSIKDALSKQLSLECRFTSDEGVTTTAYIKMGAMHVDTNAGKPDAMSMIMKDKKLYYWQVAQKQGSVMTIPDVSITPSVTGTLKPTGEEDRSQSMLAALEKFKNSCKTAVVADALFTPPADVKFTDYSQVMKQVAPSGTAPTGMSQEDVQKLMQQYKPTGTTGY